MYAEPSLGQYNVTFDWINTIQSMVIVVGFGVLWLRSRGTWRMVYANLFGCQALHMLSTLMINVAIDLKVYHTGDLYDLPLVASFLWFGAAGLIAYKNSASLDDSSEPSLGEGADRKRGESILASRLAMAAVVSLPVFAVYTIKFGHDSPAVREFRLMAILLAAVPLGFLVFLRQHLADRDRARLLARAEQSVENLQRLQAQLVQTEKLVSLGQLAAGAAHEINNPLTAILGYSDLLADDTSLPEKARAISGKIRDQARRTKTLVGNLLSFARQVPAERTLLDLNTVVTNAVQLRALDLRNSGTKIEMKLESVLPGVRGDGNQLMQVFFNIVSNAVDAMESHNGGGTLTIKTMRDRANVAILFSDTGSRPEGTASRVRPVLYHQADRQRHRAGTKHLLWDRAGTRRENSLLQLADRWRGVSRGTARSAGGPADPRVSVGAGSSAGGEGPLKSSPGAARSCSQTGAALAAFQIMLESIVPFSGAAHLCLKLRFQPKN